LDWVDSPEKAKAIAKELREFGALVAQNPELKTVLTTSVFTQKDREAVLKDLFEKISISAESKKLVLVISEMKRLRALSSIALKLSELLLRKENIVPVDVTASQALSTDEKKSIEARFTKVLGSPVEAVYVVDPKLIGGVKVTAAGKTYDGTISGWLNQFEEILVGGNV